MLEDASFIAKKLYKYGTSKSPLKRGISSGVLSIIEATGADKRTAKKNLENTEREKEALKKFLNNKTTKNTLDKLDVNTRSFIVAVFRKYPFNANKYEIFIRAFVQLRNELREQPEKKLNPSKYEDVIERMLQFNTGEKLTTPVDYIPKTIESENDSDEYSNLVDSVGSVGSVDSVGSITSRDTLTSNRNSIMSSQQAGGVYRNEIKDVYQNNIAKWLQHVKKRSRDKQSSSIINKLFQSENNNNNNNNNNTIDVEMFSDKSNTSDSSKNDIIDVEMSEENDLIDVEMSDNEAYNQLFNAKDLEISDEENDMVIDYFISKQKNTFMDFDWSLPKLNDKKINIRGNIYTIRVCKNDIKHYVKNMFTYDQNTILIPEISDNISKFTYLDETFFVSFLNKNISEFNSNNSSNILIEPFNKKEDVIYIDTKGDVYGGSLLNSITKRNSSLIFIPIKIKYTSNFHLNILVIDNKNKTFTYYEPYGDYLEYNNSSIVNLALYSLKSYMLDNYKDYKYIDAHILNKNKTLGVQRRSEDFYHISEGYCVAWCLYLCYLQMFNMHLNSEYSISTILNKVFEEYTDLHLISFIRIFTEFVIQTSTKNNN
jgi:hypothetical protein